jgi:hypothetical protein
MVRPSKTDQAGALCARRDDVFAGFSALDDNAAGRALRGFAETGLSADFVRAIERRPPSRFAL